MESLYKTYDELLDKLIERNANDYQLNYFLEMCAHDDDLSSDDYIALTTKAQNTRKIL